MMRIAQGVGLVAVLMLAGCGGGGARGVTGDVGRACMAGDREAATRALCSCVQTVAGQTLSAADQRRAAGFFSDPQQAQDAKASDTSANEAFWARYDAFVDRARAQCG